MPRLNPDLIHDKEKEEIRHFTALSDLESWEKNFQASGYLLQNCLDVWNQARAARDDQAAEGFWLWTKAAARDCAMSVYHFGRVIEGISHTLGKCPQLRGQLDGQLLRDTRKRFLDKFPGYIQLRHALAHSAETKNTDQARRKHQVNSRGKASGGGINVSSGDGDSVHLGESLMGTTFSSMREGKIYSCDISEASLMELMIIRKEYLKIFERFIAPPEGLPKVTVSNEPPPPGATIITIQT